MFLNMSTYVSGKITCNNVLCETWVAFSCELGTAGEAEPKYSFQCAVKDSQIVSSISSFYDCTSISKTVVVESEHFADWWIRLQCIETGKRHD